MIPEVATAASIVSTFKNLKELTTALRDQVPPEVRERVQDLTELLMEAQVATFNAQQEIFRLTQRCRDLEEELRRVEDWETTKSRYVLKQIGGTVVVYVQKPAVDSPEVPHWLCANCFEDRKKSYLQAGLASGLRRAWKCGRCDQTLALGLAYEPGKL